MINLPLGNDTNLVDNQFYNRTDEISFLYNYLDTTKNGSTPALLLTGIRGVGKTVLMKKLKKDLNKDYITVYMDLSAFDKYNNKITRTSFMKLLYENILSSCEDFGMFTVDKKIEKFFKTNNLKINKLLSYNNIPLPVLDTEEDYSKLANFVMNLPQTIYDEYSDIIDGIVIFIDEFQIINQLEDVNNFLWYIRSIIQSQNNIAYVFSGSMGLKDELISNIAGGNGAFGGRILNFEINPFSFETTKNYLNERAEYLNFTDDGLDRFYKCTRGIPFYINTFARLLPPNMVLDSNAVSNEFIKSLSYLVLPLTEQWYKLTSKEQKIMVLLSDGSLKRIEIANKLGVTSGAIGGSLKKLQNKVLIEFENGKYQIVDSIFKLWVKKEFSME